MSTLGRGSKIQNEVSKRCHSSERQQTKRDQATNDTEKAIVHLPLVYSFTCLMKSMVFQIKNSTVFSFKKIVKLTRNM